MATAKKKSEDQKYNKLLGKVDYDHEAVDQLAAALNEIKALDRRATQLKQIVAENEELHPFVWETANGEVLAIHNIEDNHLENIMVHLLRNGRAIPRAIRGEAISRSLTIPANVPVDWSDYDREVRRLQAGDREDII